MRNFFVLFIVILLSNCNTKPKHLNELESIKNSIWIDSLCNEYSFKDSLIFEKNLFQKANFIEPVGLLKTDSLIKLEFNYDGGDNYETYHLENVKDGKLLFKSLDRANNYKILFKKDSLKKPNLQIKELNIKIIPYFLSSRGFRELTIKNDKKIEYRRTENNSKLETATLSDSTFYQLETYLENLQLEKYKNRYEFGGHDGAKYELTLKTNRYEKTIECIQRPTEGIWNLITFLDLKLQTE